MGRRLAVVAALAAGAAAAGCGADGPGAPDELVPASALFYGHATLKPEGDQKQAVDALLRKLPGRPGQQLQDLLTRAFRESDSGLSYQRDVKPWLGREAGVFVGAPRRGDRSPDAVSLIATDDEEKALDSARKAAKGKRMTEKSYEGVDYTVVAGENAVGVVDGFLVAGTEAALKQVVDVSKGDARPMSESEPFDQALADAPQDPLATFFLNTPRLRDTLRDTLGTTAASSFGRFLRDPYVATLNAADDGVELSSTLPPAVATFFAPLLGKGAKFVEELPADAWAAGAQPEIGETIDQYVDAFASAAGGREVIERQLRSQTGLDLRRDVTGWMQDLAFFVRGTSQRTVNGALIVKTSDPASSRRLLAVLRPRLNGGDARTGRLTAPGGGDGFTLRDASMDRPVHFLVRGGRVVIAYGDDAVPDAVEASRPLGDAPGFKGARDSLGEGFAVSTFVLMQPIVELAESAGASSNPDWAKAKPYLEAIETVVAGTRERGDKVESRTKIVVP